MKISELIPEVFNIQKSIPDHSVNLPAFEEFFKQNKHTSKQVAAHVWMGTAHVENSVFYFLEHENGDILAWGKTTPTTIRTETYDHLDFVYVVPKHKHGNTIRILLYALKESVPRTLIADGAVFLDGQRVMSKFIGDHSIFHVHVLNKKTGEIEQFVELVNDPDKCYIFLKTNLPFHQQYAPAPFMESIWLWDLNVPKL
jgi:hypothetical protein